MSQRRETVAVQIKNISKYYISWSAGLKVKVIENLNFQAHEGEIVLLTGPNGSGKSTLLKMVAGLVRPTKGQISVLGHNPLKRSREFLRIIGFMPEKCRFHAGISGLEFLTYIGSLLSLENVKEKANKRLKFFGLTKWASTDVSVYSSGMRQRLGLCAATLKQPKVLLLDEPLINLDTTMKDKLVEYLQQFIEKDNILIMASHKQDFSHYHKKIEFPVRSEASEANE